jgi:hypothetical protein
MIPERLTRYSAVPNLDISAPQTRYVEHLDTFDVSEKFLKKEAAAHNKLNQRLATVHIDDEDSHRSLFAQAISAVNAYQAEKEIRDENFQPFAFFTEPNGERLLIGELRGTWNKSEKYFELQAITIKDVCDTPTQAREYLDIVQHFNPGVPKVASDSFVNALAKANQ